MKIPRPTLRLLSGMFLLTCPAVPRDSLAQETRQPDGARYEVYGHIKTDAGFMAKPVDPNWYDVMKPSKMARRPNEFGKGSNFYGSVRATRLGVRSFVPVAGQELRTTVEFDLFGVGPDAGLTTFHGRAFYGEWGRWGAGHTGSAFADPNAGPTVLDHAGPPGLLTAGNPQIRYLAIQNDGTKLMFALERPSWNNDLGIFAGRAETDGVRSRFSMPDVTGSARRTGDWGYLQVGGVLRRIAWDDVAPDGVALDVSATGWGATASSNLSVTNRDVLKVQATVGRGIQNYFGDSPVDVGAKENGSPLTPITAEALTTVGVSVFGEHKWNKQFSSTVGYSQINNDTSDGMLPDAFRLGQYAVANLIFVPDPPVQMGVEIGWWRRKNNSDGFVADNFRFAASFKHTFATGVGNGH